MSMEVQTSWSSGSLGNKAASSCVGVAGEGLPAAYYNVYGNLTVRQNDDGSIDVRQSSLTVQQNNISNATSSGTWAEDTWWFHGLYISRSSFTLYDGPGGASGYGSGVKAWSDGKISHEGYGTGNASSHYSWLSSGSSNGWQRIANNIEDLQHSSDNKYLYLYAGGLIDYSSTPTSSISIPAARITLSTSGGDNTIEDLFAYYPWERKLDDGEWWSLNRNGVNTMETGLFRLEDEWIKCTNSAGSDISKSHGFVYNEEWIRSPKSGKGA